MQTKSGFASSEFWLGLASVVLPIVSNALQTVPNYWVSLAGMALAAVYAGLRTSVKMKAADPVVPFDPNVFGSMTLAEKIAAHAVITHPSITPPVPAPAPAAEPAPAPAPVK